MTAAMRHGALALLQAPQIIARRQIFNNPSSAEQAKEAAAEWLIQHGSNADRNAALRYFRRVYGPAFFVRSAANG